MRRRFFLITNPIAGRGESSLVAEVTRRLTEAGASVERARGKTSADVLAEARAAATSGAVDAVIAAGGDGTIRVAAKAVAGSSIALGALPLGTGNVLAHELDLPRSAAALANLFLHGEARRVATATANGELFLLMVGIGFDGHVIAKLDHGVKRQVGKLAYLGPGMAAFAAPPVELRISIDGQDRTAHWAIFTNAGRYGGAFQLTRQTSIEDDGLIAVLFHDQSRLARARDIWRLARGRLDDAASGSGQGCSIIPMRQALVTAAFPVPLQIDGDPYGTTPLTIETNGPDVRLIMPKNPA